MLNRIFTLAGTALCMILISLVSCSKETVSKDKALLPECIQSFLSRSDGEAVRSVLVTILDAEEHYWLQTDNFIKGFGIEGIINKDCEQVCWICYDGCPVPKCMQKYTEVEWKEVWKK